MRWIGGGAALLVVLTLSVRSFAADLDADGVADPADTCPSVPNPSQTDSAGVGSLSPNGRGDACECGDVSGDGGAQVNDATLLRRAFAGIGPGLARRELCNTTGPADLRDQDRNGLPDDCTLADLVVLRRALVGLDPGIGTECGLVFVADATAPAVHLTAPARVTAGQGFEAVAQAEDEGGVASLEIRVDGLRAGQVASAGPLAVPVTAPELAGSEVVIEAVALDAAGNPGSASARVAIVSGADVTPPEVSLLAPPRAAPGSSVALRALASDERGVAAVSFFASGEEIASDALPPYDASFTVPAGSAPGSLVPVEARARDASGNEASAQASVQVEATGDTSAPANVLVSVPAQGRPGQTLHASASAQDDVGILAIEFLVDGVPVGEDASAPYQASFAVPADRAPGERLVWAARARDFAGNAATSPEATTLLVAAGTGLVAGEVYDDARGQPLAGALVRVVEAGGQPLDPPLEVATDARGRFSFSLVEGSAYLAIASDGYSGSERALEVLPDEVNAPLDARLTPRASAQAFDPVAGATLANGALRLALGPGAFAAPTQIRVTALSEQGLPAPLPPGWAPLAAAELSATLPLQGEARLELSPVDPPASAIAARWDLASRSWRRIALDAREAVVDALGAIALAAPDAGVAAPAVGSALGGIASGALAPGADAEILPSPRVLFLDPAARSVVTARVESASALPSGTPLVVQFSESYVRSDGRRLAPAGSTQDVLLYRRASGLEAEFPATPSPVFDGALLLEGVIDLAALAPAAQPGTSAVAGPAGAELTAEGTRLEIPAGALASPTAARLSRVASAGALLDGVSGVAFVDGLQVDLSGAALAAPLVLRVPVPASLPADAQVLVARAVPVAGATRLELVGIAELEGAELVLRPGALALPLPGADAEGRYLFLAPSAPVGFVAGVVSAGPGILLDRALVETPSLPFVSLAEAADPRFAIAASAGAVEVSGTELASGASGGGTTAVAAGDVSALDLTLSSARPAVASVDPADLAAQVDVDAAITVEFTRPIARASVTAQSFRLLDGAAPVNGQLFVGLDARTATFRPDAPLRGLSAYTVALSGEITDDFANPLLGNQLDGSFVSVFETWDTRPPAPPEPGRITLSIPRDGETEIRGTPGTLPSGMLVFAFNLTAGTSTAAAVGADGSFFALLGASSDDQVVLAVQSVAGEVTALDPIPFTDPDGTAVLSPRGGTFASSGGVQLSVLPGALARSDEVRLTDLSPADLSADLPAGLTALRGFHLEVPPALVHAVPRLNLVEETGRIVGAERAATPLRIDASRVTGTGVTTTTRFAFVARAADAQGVERALRIEAAGNPTACSGEGNAASDDVAPRLRLVAPTCLGPSQPFSVHAEAIQPRFDLETPALPGDVAGTQYVVLRRVQAGSAAVWTLVETARVELVLGAARVRSESRTPFGLRASGDYVIARADAPLGFVEGAVSGSAALVATDLSTLGAETVGTNGAFLLAVPAAQSFALRTLSPDDGSERSSESRAAVSAGATAIAGFVGPSAPAPLAVSALPPDGGTVAPTTPLRFSPSEPLDISTLSLSSLFVLDAAGRLVEGERVALAGGAAVEFRPRRPWRAGETYGWRLTTEVAARSGARLASDATGTFSGFNAALLATIPGEDVRDAVARGNAIHFIDGSRLRSIDATEPAAPVEGTAVSLTPTPNRVALDGTAADLLVSAGTSTDYGELVRFGLASPLAPALRGRLRVSTPAGAAAVPGAAPLPGTPASLAPFDSAVALSNRGIGLQRIELASLDGTPPPTSPPLAFPAGGATFADVASLGPLLASVGTAGLQLHDPATLTALAAAPLDGTAADVEVAQVDGRTLALVAAGLSGGIQAFEIGEGSPPTLTRVAKILPGCAVQRIAADAPLQRAWLACTGTRLASLDLANLDGLERIDADQDGADDRVGSALTIPVPLVSFSLDAPRNLGLVSAGAQGLAIVQLGGAEARIAEVVRDPVAGDLADAESVLSTGRVYFGDREVQLSIDARIPPGHPGLRAVLEGSGSFVDGSRERSLAPGRNTLAYRPPRVAAADAELFSVRIVDAQTVALASFTGSLERVREQDLLTVYSAQPSLSLGEASSGAIDLVGRTADGRFFNATPLATFEVERGVVGSVGPDGVFVASAGGTTEVRFRIGESVGSISVAAALPPALERLELEPRQLTLRTTGATTAIAARGFFTDGTSQLLDPRSLTWESLVPGVASVSDAGVVTAGADGASEVRATSAGVSGSAFVSTAILVPPGPLSLSLEPPAGPIHSDDAVLYARAFVRGTGSLDGIPVMFRLEGLGASREVEVRTRSSGIADFRFEGLAEPGQGTLTASATDPASGDPLSASAPVSVVARNSDLEPNDSPGSASPVSDHASIAGTVTVTSDAADRFRLDLFQEGVLLAELFVDPEPAGTARLILEDSTGAAIQSQEVVEGLAAIRAPIAAAVHLLHVEATAGSVSYRLIIEVAPSAPEIDRIEPATAPPGSTVSIHGRGFSREPERNSVTFNGVLTQVVSAAPDRLDVIVPAFATDGPVVVAASGLASAPSAFTTGTQGDPESLAFFTPEDRSRYVEFEGGRVLDNRLIVAFQAGVVRVAAETVTADAGASVVGLIPSLNLYTLEFTGGGGAATIEQRRLDLESRPEVRYALLVEEIVLNGFFIALRDSVTSPTVRYLRAAYDQVNAFEAYDAIARTGRFESRADYGNPVEVDVIDYEFDPGPAAPRFDQIVDHRDLRSGTCDFSGAFHATTVAGTLGARNLRRGSLPQVNGVAAGSVRPEVLPPYRMTVFDLCTRSQLEFALRERPRAFDVINLSLGARTGREANVHFWRDIVNLHATALFVVAAGNENQLLPAYTAFPARMSSDPIVGDRVVTVAATGIGISPPGPPDTVLSCSVFMAPGCDRNLDVQAGTPVDLGADRRAVFSNFGGVDIAAPGVSVPTVQNVISDGVKLWTGTSAATPMVAATAALVKAVHPALDARALKRLLIDTATPIGSVPLPAVNDAAGVAYSGGFGWGGWARPVRLDMLAAVNRALACRDAGVSPCPSNPVPQLAGSGPFAAPVFSPGRRRGLWVPDSLATQLFNVRVTPVVTAAGPFDRQAASVSCVLPSGVEVAPDGDELYVACRGKLAVVNSQTRGQGGVREIGIGQNNQLSFVAHRVKLALSPDGSLVAAPVIDAGSKAVLIADALSERYVTRVFLPATSSAGPVGANPVAVAFDADSNLYVVTSEPGEIDSKQRGALIRIPRRPEADRLALDQFDTSAAIVKSLTHDEPMGIEFQRVGSSRFVYVHYGGDQSPVAATVHDATSSSLKEVGSIASRLPNHKVPLVPGRIVLGTPRIHAPSSTARAFGLEIDQDAGNRGYVLYFWTGNLALLRPSPFAPFNRLSAATRFEGGVGRDLEFAIAIDPKALTGLIPQDPQLPGAAVDPNVTANKVPVYETVTFATSLDLEQGGDLLGAGYVSDRGFVRLFFPRALDIAAQNLGGDDPRANPLVDLAPEVGNVLDVDVLVDGMQAPRDIAFTPQVAVLNPKPGETVAGAVPVHVVIRDAGIERVTCRLSRGGAAVGGVVVNGGTLRPEQRDLGVAWNRLAAGNGQDPICLLRPSAKDDYELEVKAVKTSGDDVIVRVPFRYEP
jgi:hypothetical protein